MKMIFAYITNPTKEEARKIAMHLLRKKLIACANIFPINSLYWWKGKIAEENEFILIAKTINSNFEKVKKEVEKMHSYNVPCIAKIRADSNRKFLDWVKSEVKEK